MLSNIVKISATKLNITPTAQVGIDIMLIYNGLWLGYRVFKGVHCNTPIPYRYYETMWYWV